MRKGVTYRLALPVLNIGAAVSHAASGRIGTAKSKGLLKDLSFGADLVQKLDQLGLDGSDLLSQLAGLLQTGTPLATIIDRVSQKLSGALASATGNAENTQRRSTLQRALASALAPPGTSPPGESGVRKAASLQQRLATLVSTVTRALQTETAGQQNRFPGAVLDAKSAKETPAQQQTKEPSGTQTPAGALALADSILQSVVQQLQNAAPQGATQPPAQNTSGDAQPITTQSADVLGRMLARAANADVQRPAVPATRSATVSNASASPSALFAKLMQAIAQNSSHNASSGGGKQSQEFSFAKNAVSNAPHVQTNGSNGSTTPAFASTLNTATAAAVQSSTAAAAPYTIDPQSIIEQVVKGITLRNFGTTSEVRMRLQPEHLGDVSLKLTVTGNTISANIVAQNAHVRDMLLSNQQQLARALAEGGLSLGKFSVDVSGGNPGFSQQHAQQHRQLAKVGTLQGDAAEEDAWADSRFGPPVLTGAKSLVLNYLA